jgi:hypothetical protein
MHTLHDSPSIAPIAAHGARSSSARCVGRAAARPAIEHALLQNQAA